MQQQMPHELEPVPSVERWLTSNFKCSKFVYTWTMDGFRTKIQFPDYEFLEKFTEEQPRKLQWYLVINPNARRENKSVVDFGLRLMRGGGKYINTRLEFWILDPHGGFHVHKIATNSFLHNRDTRWFSVDRESLLSFKKPMIHGDRLTVRLEVSIMNTVTTTAQLRSSIKDHAHELSDDYAQLLESESHSDVTLVVGTQSFKAHKAVLVARCPVFDRMFQHDMLERSEGSVRISDVEPEVFREVLRFIYTGAISSENVLNTMALGLFAVADKYALVQLKQICEEFLAQSLTVETAVETLIAAELRNAAELKARAIDFIKGHASAVMVTGEWFRLASHPRILEEFEGKQAGPENSRED